MVGSNYFLFKEMFGEYTYKKSRGFTLLEIMICGVLFITTLTLGSVLYLSISDTQRVSAGSQRVFTESRFLLDVISNDIQAGALDYQTTLPVWTSLVASCANFNAANYQLGYPSASREPVLSLIRNDGTTVRYCISEVTGTDGVIRKQLKQQVGSQPAVILSSMTLDIGQLDFYIDPLDATDTAVPSVTIIWEATEVGPPVNPTVLHVQTTVNAGNY